MTIKTRFAPSPTGDMHFGNCRTALFNVLVALKHNGCFLLRVEDTDEDRSTQEFEKQLYEDLRWLSIDWQEGADVNSNDKNEHINKGQNGPYRQSERQDLYASYYQKLLDSNNAYYCFCSEAQLALSRKLQLSQGLPPRYAGTCSQLSEQEVNTRVAKEEKPTLRFRVNKNAIIEFDDKVKGPQSFKAADIGDFIIRRADGSSSFMFCNAIDDALMGVTLALRGEDHLTNTPRQLMILQTLNLRAPEYGHMSLIIGNDGSPLSKRNGSKSLKILRSEGYLPEAIVNYLARLGHQYEDLKYCDLNTLAKYFELSHLGKSSSHYDEQHLFHWQKEAVLHISKERFEQWLKSYEGILAVCPDHKREEYLKLMKENIAFPAEASRWAKILFTDEISYTNEQIQLLQAVNNNGKEFFTTVYEQITSIIKQNNSLDIKCLADYLKNKFNLKGKELFMPLRVAFTMEDHGPELVNLVNLMGIEHVTKRLKNLINLL